MLKVGKGPVMSVDDASATVRKVRDPVIGTGCSELPHWRTFDVCSISPSTTGIEVFKLIPRKITVHQ
jgi:hypothetical protein